jgi:hypothetical protein
MTQKFCICLAICINVGQIVVPPPLISFFPYAFTAEIKSRTLNGRRYAEIITVGNQEINWKSDAFD